MSDSTLRPCYPFRSFDARERFLAHYDELAESWPVVAERTMVSTADGETCVWVSGSSDHPPLVVLPGAWAHALMWPASLIEALSTRFRVFSVDNICDVGRSVSACPLKTGAQFAGWLDGLLDGLELSDGISLMGISRGAWITGEYLLLAPQRVARAVLLSPPQLVSGPSPESIRGAHYSLATLVAPSIWSVRGLMRSLMPYWARSEPEAFERYVADTAMALKAFDTRKVCRFWGPRIFTDDELRRIDRPVLYMAGEKETTASPAKAVARLNIIAPHFETAFFPEAAHDLVDVHTAAVATRMLEFLAASPGLTQQAHPADAASARLG